MKDKIQKLAEGLANAVTLLKEEKIPEATEALAEVATGVAELDTAATEQEAEIAKSKTELAEKTEAVQKSEEEIKKWANISISAESMKEMAEDLKALKELITGNVEVMKSVSTKEDISTLSARLDTIEKAKEEKALKDETRSEMKKSALGSIDLSPGK